jgi:hypothetical protein
MEKKKLTLYPFVIVKCKDLGIEKSKSRHQILMGVTHMIKGQQLREMNVTRAIILDKDNSDINNYTDAELKG